MVKEITINLRSDLWKEIHRMYQEMGDQISLQYGGSKAHHSVVGQKKGVLQSLPEFFTSIQRHLANNFTDPQKQNALNLFLGIYQPLKNKAPLWTINDDRELMLSMDQIPEEHQTSLDPCWWERHFRGFEAGLPLTLINHTLLFNKPSEGDVTQQQIEPD